MQHLAAKEPDYSPQELIETINKAKRMNFGRAFTRGTEIPLCSVFDEYANVINLKGTKLKAETIVCSRQTTGLSSAVCQAQGSVLGLLISVVTIWSYTRMSLMTETGKLIFYTREISHSNYNWKTSFTNQSI